MKRQIHLYFIVVGTFLLFISSNFLSEGLSRVGMDNAVVSQRMAEGFEEFWLPSLSSPGNPDRMNYMPLGYWLESLWYRVFANNTFMAEKVYSVLTYFIIALLMIWIWRLVGFPKHTGWLPLGCWISIPLVTWSATNNLLESTMTMFVLLSVVFLLKSFKASFISQSRLALDKPQGAYRLSRTAWIILAALMMELAFMVKGVVGLFPVFLPFIYWIFVRRERILFPIYATVVIIVVWMVSLFTVILASHDIYTHLYDYLHRQLIGGVLHVQTVSSHFYILYVLLIQSVIPLLIAAVISIIRIKRRPFWYHLFYWRNESRISAETMSRARWGWMFFSLAIVGLLPIMIGLKQQDFYIVPLLPFFAIALACFIYNSIYDWLENINHVAEKVLIVLAVILFGSGLLLNLNSINKINSNQALLSDMKYILPYLNEEEVVSASHEVMNSPEVAEYFYRYKKITFDTNNKCNHLISLYSTPHDFENDVSYVMVDIPTNQYRLFEIKQPTIDTVTLQDF